MQKLIPIIALSAHPYTASIAPRASSAPSNTKPARQGPSWSCEDQADWSKRVDVAVGGGSGVSHKLYEKTPRKGLAENPRQRSLPNWES